MAKLVKLLLLVLLEIVRGADNRGSCDFTSLINQQINDELTASQFYFQMSYKFKHHNQTR